MSSDLSVARIWPSWEARATHHREQQAFHAQQETHITASIGHCNEARRHAGKWPRGIAECPSPSFLQVFIAQPWLQRFLYNRQHLSA